MFNNIPKDKLHYNYKTIVMGWDTGVLTEHDTTIALSTIEAARYHGFKPKRWWEFWRDARVTYTCFPHDNSKDTEFYND